ITRTSGTVYYLRSKNTSNQWSTARTINYTITSPTTWYEDQDGDDLGDPNSTQSACSQPSGYVSNSDDLCPTQSGTVANNGCPENGVTTYTSNFEAGFGDWSQETYEDFDWTHKSGSTGSGSTGPTSASEGSYYIYTEASSPNYPSKTAVITSTAYALESSGTFTFDYHMYGATMGQLTLSASTNGGSSWQAIWSMQGDQGNLWHTAQVDLSGYQDTSVMFRFTGVTGSSYTGDMSIDNIIITSQASVSTTLSDENYIYTITPTEPTTDVSSLDPEQKIEAVTYYDGLGRPMQSVGIRAGGDSEDIITHIEYDAYGRQVKEYLPIPGISNNGSYKAIDTLIDIHDYYYDAFPGEWSSNSVANPYSRKQFENSPLNRVLKQAAPGEDWKLGNSNEIEFDYKANTTNEVRLFTVDLTTDNITYTPTLNENGYYLLNTLYKTITRDENNSGTTKNHTTEEFKDKQGRVVLKRTYADVDLNGDGDTNDTGETEVPHDTYYVYDDYGNLTYVLPPKIDATPNTNTISNIRSLLDELGYQYKYDKRNRLVEKKIPGKDWEYIVYSLMDQPVMTQDKLLQDQDKWLFTKYDAFGRVVYTGVKNSTASRTVFDSQSYNTTSYTQFEERITSPRVVNGTQVYYSSTTNPSVIDDIYTINYYDDYVDLPSGLSNTITTYYGLTSTANTKGLPTVSKVKVLGTSNWITTVTYYDDKGRVIYVYSKNDYLETTDIVESKLDFTRVLETKTTHQKTNKDDIVTIDKFDYDHAGRFTKQTQTLDGNTEVIAENTYDELGQVESKGVGGKTTQSRLQTIDYTYNVRGWLKNINQDAYSDNDLFNYTLMYNDIADTSKKLFNGNISQTSWNTLNDDSSIKTYTYTYDALNRITAAIDNTANYNLTNVDYDKNGNISNLVREGYVVDNPVLGNSSHFGTMDNLTYSYDSGNKLLKVSDVAAIDQFGFKDDAVNTTADTVNDYTYDENGNLKSDTNKGITNITYNHLNLPETIAINSHPEIGTILYIYDATGVKLRKVVNNTVESSVATTDYAGNYVYENDQLQFFNHAEGYVEPNTSGGFDYIYQYKDQVGNIRLSYSDSDENGSINPSTEIVEENNYYPFGLKHKGYNNVINGTDHPYGFGGKEEQDELGLGWHDFDARNYDAALGRWMNLDPLAEDYYQWSPYNYAFSSPMIFVDPTGLGPIYDKDGNLIGYEVEEGQGPTQIAEDLNTIGLQAEVTHMDIVNSNPEKFEHIEDPTDVNDEGFTELDINTGDIISVDTVVDRENSITEDKKIDGEISKTETEMDASVAAEDKFNKQVDSLQQEWLDFMDDPKNSHEKYGNEPSGGMGLWRSYKGGKIEKKQKEKKSKADSVKKVIKKQKKKLDSLNNEKRN
ncbi:MAG: DUF6443 domain-containing protein, partial [Bacteroidota bacterium]